MRKPSVYHHLTLIGRDGGQERIVAEKSTWEPSYTEGTSKEHRQEAWRSIEMPISVLSEQYFLYIESAAGNKSVNTKKVGQTDKEEILPVTLKVELLTSVMAKDAFKNQKTSFDEVDLVYLNLRACLYNIKTRVKSAFLSDLDT